MFQCFKDNYLFYAAFASAIVLSFVPLLGKFTNVINTLIHETGHAIICLLTSGEVVSIRLSHDASGAAQTKSKYWLGKFLISLAGYPFSSLSAYLLFYFIYKHSFIWIFYILLSLAIINLILWVRNSFGIIWLIVLGTSITLVYIYTNDSVKYFTSVLISSIILLQSISTTFIIGYISITDAKKAGDAKNLRDFTYLPAFIWSLFFITFAIWMGYKSVLLFPCFG